MLKNQGLRGRLRKGFWNGALPMSTGLGKNRMIGYEMSCYHSLSL